MDFKASAISAIKLGALALIASAVSTVILVMFRWLYIQGNWYLDRWGGQIHGLDIRLYQFLLPLLGALIIYYGYSKAKPNQRGGGLIYVFNQQRYLDAIFPLSNTLLHIQAAIVMSVSGFCMGIIGPCIHLASGANVAFFRKWLPCVEKRRILAACGCSATITAMLGLPFAAIVFGYESMLRSHKREAILPMGISVLVAFYLSEYLGVEHRSFVGHFQPEQFDISIVQVLVLGFLLSAISALMVYSLRLTSHLFSQIGMFKKLAMSGLLMGIVCALWPDLSGIGFESAFNAITANLTTDKLVWLILAKVLLCGVFLALGVPGGVIGPSIVLSVLTGVLVALWLGQTGNTFIGIWLIGLPVIACLWLRSPMTAIVAVVDLTGTFHLFPFSIMLMGTAWLFYYLVFQSHSLTETIFLIPQAKAKR